MKPHESFLVHHLCIAVIFLSGSAVDVRGIMLGGNQVARDSFLVFICMGNSNMSGRVAVSDQEVHPRLWRYHIPCGINGEPTEEQLHTWTPARDPICGSGGGGPGMPLLKAMIDAYPDYYFGIMQHSGSGSKHYTCRDQFQKGKDGYGTILGAAMRERAEVTFAGIIAMLGDVEVQSTSGFSSWDHINNFASDIASMVSSLREDLALPAGQLPYLHTEIPYGEGLWDPATDECTTLREQIDQIPALIPHSAVISSEGITLKDDHHYNYNGYLMWADKVVELVAENGWAPGHESVSLRHSLRQSRRAPHAAFGTKIRLSNCVGCGAGYRIDGTPYTPATTAGRHPAGVLVYPGRSGWRKPKGTGKE